MSYTGKWWSVKTPVPEDFFFINAYNDTVEKVKGKNMLTKKTRDKSSYQEDTW